MLSKSLRDKFTNSSIRKGPSRDWLFYTLCLISSANSFTLA